MDDLLVSLVFTLFRLTGFMCFSGSIEALLFSSGFVRQYLICVLVGVFIMMSLFFFPHLIGFLCFFGVLSVRLNFSVRGLVFSLGFLVGSCSLPSSLAASLSQARSSSCVPTSVSGESDACTPSKLSPLLSATFRRLWRGLRKEWCFLSPSSPSLMGFSTSLSSCVGLELVVRRYCSLKSSLIQLLLQAFIQFSATRR